MRLQKEVLHEVVGLIGEITERQGRSGPAQVQQRFIDSDVLKQFVVVGSDPERALDSPLARAVTIAGNIAAEEIRHEKPRLMGLRKFFKQEMPDPAAVSREALIVSLPAILEALAQKPDEITYPREALLWLDQQQLLPEEYVYSANLVGKLEALARMLPTE